MQRCCRAMACALALAGCSDDQGSTSVTGNVAIPGASAPFLVGAFMLDGTPVAHTTTDGSGAFALEIHGSETTLVVGAVLASDPNHMALHVLDVQEHAPAPAFDLQAEHETSVTVSPRSSAEAIALARQGFEGDLDADVEADVAALTAEWMRIEGGMCDGEAGRTPAAMSALRRLMDNAPVKPALIQQLENAANELPIGSSLPELIAHAARMQQIISDAVQTTNVEDVNVVTDIWRHVWLGITRVNLVAGAGEALNEMTEGVMTPTDVARVGFAIGWSRYGNCRENAYMGAYTLALLAERTPLIRQAGAIGMLYGPSFSEHAFAVACTEGPEVFDLASWSLRAYGPDELLAETAIEQAGCFVVDPWKGTTVPLDIAYMRTDDWRQIQTVRPLVLPDRPVPIGGDKVATCDCNGTEVDACAPLQGSSPTPGEPLYGACLDDTGLCINEYGEQNHWREEDDCNLHGWVWIPEGCPTDGALGACFYPGVGMQWESVYYAPRDYATEKEWCETDTREPTWIEPYTGPYDG